MKTADISALKAAMSAAGYEPEVEDQSPSMVLTIQGLQKSWKTRLALTAPSPIAYHGIDTGSEGPLQDARDAGKVIFPKFHSYDLPREMRIVPEFPPHKVDNEGKKVPSNEEIAFYEKRAKWVDDNCWLPFEDSCDAAIKAGVRTIIFDTESEIWEMKRLSRFGRLLQNPQLFYGKANGEYRAFLKRLADSAVNVILIRQLVEKYNAPGVYEAQGFKHINFVVDAAVEMTYVPAVKRGQEEIPEKYRCKVVYVRQGKGRTGLVLENTTFPELAAVLKPAVDANAWED